MRNTIALALLVLVLVLGCSGHEQAAPTSTPIEPITTEAVFVVNGGDASISVIDTGSDTVIGTIVLHDADFPHHVYLDAGGDRMLVAVPGADLSAGHGGEAGEHGGHGGAVMLLDASTGATLAARRLGGMNHNAIFSPDGTSVWTSQDGEPGTVLVLDPDTLETLASIQVGNDPSEITFAPAGDVAFVANTGSDTVSIVEVATREVVATLDVEDTPVGAWPGSNGLMYVDNEGGESLSVIDPVAREVVATIDLAFAPALAAIAPDGTLWVSDPTAGRIAILDAATGDEVGEIVAGAGAHAIVFDSTGTKAYVTNQDAASVSVVDVGARALVDTIPVGSRPNGMALRVP